MAITMSKTQILQQIRGHIADSQFDEALTQLQAFAQNNPSLSRYNQNAIIHQSSRYAGIKQQIGLGIVSQQDSDRTLNQIRIALLDLVN
jgi:Effector-associated domain 11